MGNKEIGVGILGLGNVGKGTLDIIEKNKKFIEKEITPSKIKITGLADLDRNRQPASEELSSVFTSSAEKVISNPATNIVVEAIGGEYPAYNLIKRALQAGKHVVSPNKELIAKHGYELLEIAKEKQVKFLFETSVGSAIPILGVISNILTSCPLEEISGILNGTTNYILDLMLEQNLTQKEALIKAQEMGYAEADPSKDIKGIDALYKIFILSSLGFHARLNLDQIQYSGIEDIELEDILLAENLDYRIKLFAIARKKAEYLDIRVQPLFVEKNSIFSNIHGADNGIMLYGESYGDLFFAGAGAGGIAGGSMIVSDIVRIIRQHEYYEYDYLLEESNELKIKICDENQSPYFIRIRQNKKQAGIDRIKEILTQNGISINRFARITSNNNDYNIGVLTEPIKENKIKQITTTIEKQYDDIEIMNLIKVLKNSNK